MNAKLTAITIAMVAMVAMTGFAAALDTNVYHSGDGFYNAAFDGSGTGALAIHTFTSNGYDHAITTWENADASGTQSVDGVDTIRDFEITSHTYGGNSAGQILTITGDDNNNSVIALVKYENDENFMGYLTLDQTFAYDDSYGPIDGIVAETSIVGWSLDIDGNTTLIGLVETGSEGAYTLVQMNMTQGGFIMDTTSVAGTLSWFGDYGVTGQTFDVYQTSGVGTLTVGTGASLYGYNADMTDIDGTQHYEEYGADYNMTSVTNFGAGFEATGYVYSIDY